MLLSMLALVSFHVFTFQSFGLAQGVLTTVIALSAFAAVSFNKHITFGKYDWKLLLTITSCPAIVGLIMLALDWLGPSGYW